MSSFEHEILTLRRLIFTNHKMWHREQDQRGTNETQRHSYPARLVAKWSIETDYDCQNHVSYVTNWRQQTRLLAAEMKLLFQRRDCGVVEAIHRHTWEWNNMESIRETHVKQTAVYRVANDKTLLLCTSIWTWYTSTSHCSDVKWCEHYNKASKSCNQVQRVPWANHVKHSTSKQHNFSKQFLLWSSKNF